jgi:NAD(P)-dependent dehydrogenase (short-subunit alcohol dehydrogenase family)
MKPVIVTGSAGLIGSECVIRLAAEGFKIPGIAKDPRKGFLGEKREFA